MMTKKGQYPQCIGCVKDGHQKSIRCKHCGRIMPDMFVSEADSDQELSNKQK